MAVVLLFSIAWFNQYTPQPDLTWDLREATEEENRFFSWQLPRYVYHHSRRNALLAAEVGEDRLSDSLTEESLKLEQEEVLEAASELSPELKTEVLELIDALDSVDVAGRRWYAAIRPINERIREEGLPFFLKGTYSEFVPEGEKKRVRMYFLGSYRVKDIQHYSFDGRRYGAIHATKDSLFYEAGLPLGYVHPDEPFALIMVDEVEDHVRALVASVADEGSCGLSHISAHSIDAIDLDLLCGNIMSAAFSTEGILVGESQEEAINELLKREIHATEVHEIQHQIDGNTIEIPGELFRLIPIASDRQLSRSAYEISAYLTQLSLGDELTTASTLASLSTHLMTPGQVQTPYRYAAGIILSELTGIQIIRPMGRVRMLKLLEAWKVFSEQGEDLPGWVSERASDLHEELLGTPAAIPSRI